MAKDEEVEWRRMRRFIDCRVYYKILGIRKRNRIGGRRPLYYISTRT